MGSWGASACYPRRTFDPLSESLSTKNSRITMVDFRLCLICQSYSQASLYHCALQLISDQSELTFTHLRYFLGGRRPSQTPHHALFLWSINEKTQTKRVVFQVWIRSSHLSYTVCSYFQCKARVKVHGVLPSNRLVSASARRVQFHSVHLGDSGAVVTPFMRVATYATRNFAHFC